MIIFAPEDVALNYFTLVFDATIERYQGRVHWGKHFSATPDDVKKWYPKFEDFLVKRKQMDPKDVFVNDFIQETFLGGSYG